MDFLFTERKASIGPCALSCPSELHARLDDGRGGGGLLRLLGHVLGDRLRAERGAIRRAAPTILQVEPPAMARADEVAPLLQPPFRQVRALVRAEALHGEALLSHRHHGPLALGLRGAHALAE